MIDFRPEPTCDECIAQWCHHMLEVIQEGQDAVQLWHELNEMLQSRANGHRVIVPIFPSHKPPLSVTILLVPFSVENRIFKVLLTHSVGRVWDDGDDDPSRTVMLGFTTEGEGRQVYRDMVLSWLRPKFTQYHYSMITALQCSASTHGFRAEKIWSSNMKKLNANSLAQLLSVWDTGRCVTCQADVADNFDDLVPDEKARSWR